MLLGLPTRTTWPVGVSVPARGSTRKATIVSLSWLAA
jgi:hypothetical protein